MDALARNAPDAEIERLMQELRQAIDNFLRAMTEQAMERAQKGEQPVEMKPGDRMMSSEDIKRMLDRARDLARSGARDAARDMLAQLQRMLENLKEGRLAQSQGQGQAGEAMKELGDLVRRQQELLDRSFRRSQQAQRGQQGQQGQRGQQGQQGQRGQQGQQGQQGQGGEQGEGEFGEGEGDGEGEASAQESLRRRLGQIMGRIGEAGGDIPGAFGRAERAMRQAAEALRGGRYGQAVPPQTSALDQLRQGARDMMDQMMGMPGDDQGPGQGQERMGRPSSPRLDPLGRPYFGDWDTGDSTKVPEEADLQRAREILEELLRRSGDRRRPALELDYIERLLRRF